MAIAGSTRVFSQDSILVISKDPKCVPWLLNWIAVGIFFFRVNRNVSELCPMHALFVALSVLLEVKTLKKIVLDHSVFLFVKGLHPCGGVSDEEEARALRRYGWSWAKK